MDFYISNIDSPCYEFRENAEELAERHDLKFSNKPSRLTPQAMDDAVDAIKNHTKFKKFGDRNFMEMATESFLCFYVGMSKRLISDEWTGFLTPRGRYMPTKKAYKSGRYTRNLPILVDRQNDCITAGEFKSYGGDWVQVFESLWMDEACHVEACLQRATQHLKKGRRLFHAVAMGAKYKLAVDKDDLDAEIYKVFVTFIHRKDAIKHGLKIQKSKKVGGGLRSMKDFVKTDWNSICSQFSPSSSKKRKRKPDDRSLLE